MDDGPQPVDRRQAVAGLLLIGTLSLALVGTILFRIVTSPKHGGIARDAARLAQESPLAPGATDYAKNSQEQLPAADAPVLMRDSAVGAASHTELTAPPRFIAPAK